MEITFGRCLLAFLLIMLLGMHVHAAPLVVSPADDSVLGVEQTFTWSYDNTNPAYWALVIGSAPGQNDYASRSGTSGETSVTIDYLPSDGRQLFTRLWVRDTAGHWQHDDIIYSAASLELPELVLPVAGASLSAKTAIFEWAPGDIDQQYWAVVVGPEPGSNSIASRSGTSSVTSVSIGNLPVDGSTLYVRLWVKSIDGAWYTDTKEFTAAQLAEPEIVSPAEGTTLATGELAITWELGSITPAYWAVVAGSAPGMNNYASKSGTTAQTTVTLTGLPTQGQDLYVRLWVKDLTGNWFFHDRAYTAATVQTPELTAPANHSTFASRSELFEWNVGEIVPAYWAIVAGSTPGANNYGSRSGVTVRTSAVLANLPTDGSPVYVRLWVRDINGRWYKNDHLHTAANGVIPGLTSPVNGETLSGAIDTFTWDSGADPINSWILYLGSDFLRRDYTSRSGTNETSSTVANLPTSGQLVYASLFVRTVDGSFYRDDKVYRAATPYSNPYIVAPMNNATLGGESVSFTWNSAGLSAQAWRLRVGSGINGAEYADLSGSGSVTTYLVTGLPTDGSDIFVQLSIQDAANQWHSSNSTYKAMTAPVNLEDYELVFADEFNCDPADGSCILDSSKWNTGYLWGPYFRINNELQFYVDSVGINSKQESNGNACLSVNPYCYTGADPFSFNGSSLTISAMPVSSSELPVQPSSDDSSWLSYSEYVFNPKYNNLAYVNPNDPIDLGYVPEYTSGLLTSYDSFQFTHGYIESRMKVPAGRGLWPAFWLLNTKYVEDFPEIDIMEFLGAQPTTEVYHSYHYVDYYYDHNFDPVWQAVSLPTFVSTGPDYSANFHTYSVAWSPKEIVWYIDGVEKKRINQLDGTIARQSMYILANLAVGGNWPGPPDAETLFPAELEIDYIRAYQKTPPTIVTTAVLQSHYELMFSDEFNGASLDAGKWKTGYLWGPTYSINSEEQYYVDVHGIDATSSLVSPFSLDGGILTITAKALPDIPAGQASPYLPQQLAADDQVGRKRFPTHQFNPAYNNPNYSQGEGPWIPAYTSGVITSYESFKFVDGYVEARIKVPAGAGLWPAFWLLNGYYVGPQPEIDIMEMKGENPEQVYTNYHYSDSIGNLVSSESVISPGTNLDQDFHTYGIEWHPNSLSWYIDGNRVRILESPHVSTQLMYIIMNLAVGGNFGHQFSTDPAVFPALYQIDYVRAYQLK